MTDTLRKLAGAATPGPWHVANKTVALLQDDFFQVNSLARWVCLVEDGSPFSKQDAAFIAAANPTAVIALLDEIDALRAKVKAQQEALDNRRANLEFRTHRDNSFNSRMGDMPGVFRCKQTGRFGARANAGQGRVFLGRFDTFEEAADAVARYKSTASPSTSRSPA